MATSTLPTETTLPVEPHLGRRRRSGGGHSSRFNAGVYLVAVVVIALMLAPVVYIVLGGFRTNSQITADPAGFPSPWNVGNYLDVLTGGLFWHLALNSTIVGLITTLGVVSLGLMASYAIARYEFATRGRCMHCSLRG